MKLEISQAIYGSLIDLAPFFKFSESYSRSQIARLRTVLGI
jgi:hypothetical protein